MDVQPPRGPRRPQQAGSQSVQSQGPESAALGCWRRCTRTRRTAPPHCHYCKRQISVVTSSSRYSTNNTTTLPLLRNANMKDDLVQQEHNEQHYYTATTAKGKHEWWPRPTGTQLRVPSDWHHCKRQTSMMISSNNNSTKSTINAKITSIMISSNKNSTDNTTTLPLVQKANMNGDLVQQELNGQHYYTATTAKGKHEWWPRPTGTQLRVPSDWHHCKRQTSVMNSSNLNSTKSTIRLTSVQKAHQ